jgi:uncharacterized protein YqcC (DUF446 family)
MEKSKEEFILFIHQAMHDKSSPAYNELYHFLVNCFVHADTKMEGRIYLDHIDALIDEAAALPRRYGYAPKAETLYATNDIKKATRTEMFRAIDQSGHGYISLEQWILYANEHILGKIGHLPKDYLGGTSDNVTKEEFLTFIKKAVVVGTPEYQQLYFFLLTCFQKGDVNKTGAVDPVAFDKMIEEAAAAPRRFGLAPKTSEMFKSDAARLAKRKEYFANMDTDGNGSISFDEWLDYAHKHIVGKVNGL